MKIAVIKQPFTNHGDESAHKAFMHSLLKAFPDYQIDVLFIGAPQYHINSIRVDGANYINIPSSRGWGRMEKVGFKTGLFSLSYIQPTLRKFKNLLSLYDLVICAPGGICMGGFMNWDHIWQLTVAKKLNKPIIYWGRSIGPFSEEDFNHRVFKKYSLALLNYFKFISLRDSESIKIANSLGIDCIETVDSAFLERPSCEIPESLQNELGNSKYLVFVPNELKWHYKYKNTDKEKIDSFYMKIISSVTEKYPDSKILMIPQLYKAKITDFPYFKYLQAKCGNKIVLVLDEETNSDVQQKIISNAQLVIGGRYHSIVFAINNKVPFISLSYEHKMTGLLEKLNLTKRLVKIQDIFTEGNQNLYDAALDKVKSLLDATGDCLPEISPKEIAHKAFDKMVNKISLMEGSL